ncbi:hypothetical protein ABZW30_38365 [Kitasatospora sp. NPDC004669]|uniref:hypothetical protein n=1 Tax=Kitasatospora sp. NPDC004669 TaxID=3154555 RepID=UPI0033A34B0F
MSTTDPHTACPVPDVLPDPWAVPRGTDRSMPDTVCGVGTEPPRVLARMPDPDLTMPRTRKALDGLEPVRHQNTDTRWRRRRALDVLTAWDTTPPT